MWKRADGAFIGTSHCPVALALQLPHERDQTYLDRTWSFQFKQLTLARWPSILRRRFWLWTSHSCREASRNSLQPALHNTHSVLKHWYPPQSTFKALIFGKLFIFSPPLCSRSSRRPRSFRLCSRRRTSRSRSPPPSFSAARSSPSPRPTGTRIPKEPRPECSVCPSPSGSDLSECTVVWRSPINSIVRLSSLVWTEPEPAFVILTEVVPDLGGVENSLWNRRYVAGLLQRHGRGDLAVQNL